MCAPGSTGGNANNLYFERCQSIYNRRYGYFFNGSDDPEPLVAVGRVVGEIALEPIGANGFGFDPVMFIPEFGKTFAQLPVEVKNANSHRGRAAAAMVALMRERWL